MKRKICSAILLSCSCLMFVAAGKVDTCTEKYNSCLEICENAKAKATAGGSMRENVENRFTACKNECIKAKNACEAKPKKP